MHAWNWQLKYTTLLYNIQVCSADDPRMWPFYDEVKFTSPYKMLEKSFSENVLKTYGRNLQCMNKVINDNQNFDWRPTFVQMMILGWPLIFYGTGKFPS